MEPVDIYNAIEEEFFEDEAAKEVARKDGFVLYESVYECNGCPINVLKEFFPDYDFNEYYGYLIEIDGTLYDGDSFKDWYYQREEAQS